MLSLAKYMTARTMTQASGLPSLLVIRFTDIMKFITFDNVFPMTMGGRTATTRDDRDLEPVVDIPIDKMMDL